MSRWMSKTSCGKGGVGQALTAGVARSRRGLTTLGQAGQRSVHLPILGKNISGYEGFMPSPGGFGSSEAPHR
jgi:hypothetical protein